MIETKWGIRICAETEIFTLFSQTEKVRECDLKIFLDNISI